MTEYLRRRPPKHEALVRLLVVSALLLVAVLVVILRDSSTRGAAFDSVERVHIYEGGSGVEAVDLVAASLRAEGASGAGVEITLMFSGTNAEGVRVPIYSIPQLDVYRYPLPERVAVKVPALLNWDALSTLNLDGQNLIKAAFCYNHTIYLQMSAPVSVSLEGVGGSLLLHLEPRAMQKEAQGFNVLIDAVTRGDMIEPLDSLENIGINPALCADGETILAQSHLIQDESSAIALAREAERICGEFGLTVSARVVRASGGAPPSAIETISAGERERVWGGLNAQLIMSDARIIAQAQSAAKMLIRRSNGAVMILGEQSARKPLPLTAQNFSDMISDPIAAALSADASYSALSTADGELAVLDNITGRARTLGDPITPNTTAFAWMGDDGLYAMSGDPMKFYYIKVDGAFFDETSDSDTGTAMTADPFAGSQGELVSARDALFLGETDGFVYRLNLAAQTRVSVGLADRFAISPDGSAMLLMTGDESGAALTWVNVADRSANIIGMGMPVVDFCVDADGRRAYILQRERGGTRLYAYTQADKTLKPLAVIPEGDLFASREAGTILVNIQEQNGGWSVYKIII
ncbi:MAG: hypothetical protein LBS72_06100 [Oscillospiraceae bacterium]|jgi:hypothetical protein|nr:hypothetical protein [Oscillospiraceae bacterium]